MVPYQPLSPEQLMIWRVPSDQSSTFDTYTQYVDSLVPQWPEFRPLSDYLHQKPKKPEGVITVLDTSDVEMTCRYVGPIQDGAESPLRAIEAHVKTRIVVVSYQDIHAVDRSLVDTLGTIYDIDPTFFSDLILQEGKDTDNSGLDRRKMTPHRLLRSRQRSLNFGNLQRSNASVCFLSYGQTETPIGMLRPSEILTEDMRRDIDIGLLVFVMLNSNAFDSSGFEFQRPSMYSDQRCQRALQPREDLSLRVRKLLLAWDRAKIQSANAAPVEFIFPLVRLILDTNIHILSLDNYGHRLETSDWMGSDTWLRENVDVRTKRYLHALHTHQSGLRMSRESLDLQDSRIPWISGLSKSQEGAALIRDIEELLDVVGRMIETHQSAVARIIGYHSLLAAKSSIEQSKNIGRITFLVFLFIPLSFVTSIFGMNIQEFGRGIPIIVFSQTSVILVPIVILIWFLPTIVSSVVPI